MTALYIVLGIIALIVLLFCIKVSVTATYDETFTLDIGWLFLKFRIYPLSEEQKAKREAKKAKKKAKKKPEKAKTKEENTKEPQKPKNNIFKQFYENQGFDATLELIRTAASRLSGFMKRVYKAFVIEKLVLLLKVSSGDDAAHNAIKYGKVCSAVYPSLGFVCSNMKVKKYDVNVVPDFISGENKAFFELSLSVRPIKLTNAAIALVFNLVFKVLIKLLKGSKDNKSV